MEVMRPEDYQRLKQRLDSLVADRTRIAARLEEARAHGDLSENAEYDAAKEEQAMSEAEIRRLHERLKNAKVVDNEAVPDDIVFVGATVRLRDTANGEEEMYRIVGEASGTFDPDSEVLEVTTESPMGQSLMKARLGETVRVDLPRGSRRFEVLEIQ